MLTRTIVNVALIALAASPAAVLAIPTPHLELITAHDNYNHDAGYRIRELELNNLITARGPLVSCITVFLAFLF